MSDQKPIVYILRGDDEDAIKSHIQRFYNNLSESDMAEMNTTRLEGRSADINDLRAAALALPFLTERRLVILENALGPFNGRDKQNSGVEFLAFLESLPISTALVLIIPDSVKFQRGQMRWEKCNDKHWLIRWANQAGGRALIVDCPLPTDREMPVWVRRKAVELGGNFTPHAAATLAEFIGNDTRRGVQEIIKLLTYVNFARSVEDDDVRRLTTQEYQSDVFALVDAIGNRDGQTALNMLHLLLEEMDFMPLFGMIIRQFRLLIQTREILDGGGNEGDVTRLLNIHPYVAEKIFQQSQKFNLSSLEEIYHQLLEIDLGEKTGGMPGDLALDVLIAGLSN